MYKKKAKYEVMNHENETILSGDILGELIATTILETFKYLDNEKNLLYKIEENYFSFYNVLAGIYKDSNYFYWDNVSQIELIHNNDTFLNQRRFIKFKRNTWNLVKAEVKLNINLNLNQNISWCTFKKQA